MKNDYKITVFKTDNKKDTKIKIPSFLPQIPFRLSIFAPSYSGKTMLIVNMLFKKSFKYKEFSEKIFFCLVKQPY
jgi:hypothetical protein